MGNWHKSKKRNLPAPSSSGFEVQFEAPVIFVSFPANENKPVPDVPIYYINGSKESYEKTLTLPPNEEKDWTGPRSSRVHTADNERATWVTLLSELQAMEQQSQKWQEKQYGKSPPGPLDASGPTLTITAWPSPCRLRRGAGDTMPSSGAEAVRHHHYLPPAGDRRHDGHLLAGVRPDQGPVPRRRNGYMLTGTNVTDLGTVFTFQISGKRKFEENRVIPCGRGQGDVLRLHAHHLPQE